ncbi:CHAT domain-containing tetratricopeptide repeat protein [Anaerolineales bacterium HSG24]|nr:CHAT domain-containing tetratricopeptide repeat protein [Anaerolineales bacterium HSG24]
MNNFTPQIILLTLLTLLFSTPQPSHAAQDTNRCYDLYNQAQGLSAQGELTSAQNQYQDSLDCFRQNNDRVGERWAINGLGRLDMVFGNYEQASERFNQALTLAQEIEDKQGEVSTLTYLGQLYSAQGDYEAALEAYQQALPIFQVSDNKTNLVVLYNSMGKLYFRQGDYEQALNAFQQTLAMAQKIGDRRMEAIAFEGIGAIYYQQGDFDQALDLFKQSLAIFQEIGGKNRKASLFGNIGVVYHSQGDYEQAQIFYQQSLSLYQEIGLTNDEIMILNYLGQLYVAWGNVEEARKSYEQLIDLSEQVGGQQVQPDDWSLPFASQRVDQYEAMIRLLVMSIGSPEPKEAFAYVQRAKARAFLNQMGNVRPQPRSQAEGKMRELEENIRQTLLWIDWQISGEGAIGLQRVERDSSSLSSQELKDRRDDLQKQHQDLLKQIIKENPQYDSLVMIEPASLSQIQKQLPADTTLVEYYLLREYNQGLVFVITAHDFKWQLLDMSQLESTIENFHLGIKQDTYSQQVPDTMKTLYTQLIEPIEDNLTTPHLLIAPHGQLHYLPFAALHDGQNYLVERYQLSQIASGSLLPFIPKHGPTLSSPPLVMGNPSNNLKGGNQEAETIAQQYGLSAYLKKQATELTFWEQADQAGLIHLSTHGQYDADSPLHSYLTLNQTKSNGMGKDSGSLDVYEIYDLILPATDLVVLSACETQLGQNTPLGDEMLSFNRAFMYAGAASVVGSLWKVGDEATEHVMTRFYTHLNDGQPKAEALRLAQIETMQHSDYGHPFYWSAFVLTGNTSPSTVATCQADWQCRTSAWLQRKFEVYQNYLPEFSTLMEIGAVLVVIIILIAVFYYMTKRDDVEGRRRRRRR